MRSILRIALYASGLALSAMTAGSANQDFSAFPGDGHVPGEGRHVHDPTIIFRDGSYFCFSTSGNGFGVLRSSVDLDHWKVHGPIMPETPQWLREKIPQHRSTWAPDIVFMPDGALRLYYCASETFGRNTSFIGVAENRSFDPKRPDHGWEDLGLVIESRAGKDDFNAIDPEVLLDEKGRLWMFFGSYWSGLYVVELDLETGKRKAGAEMILVARNTGGGANAIEAPAVIKRGEYYHLFVSYGAAAQGVRGDYHIVGGRSKSITGPFVDPDGKPMLEGGHAVILNASSPMFGPGHCDLFRAQDGRILLAHHYYDSRHYWVGGKWGLPTLQVRELIWTEDGWPLPGMPLPFAGGRSSDAGGSLAGRWVHQENFTEPRPLTFTEDGKFRDGSGGGQWSRTDGNLVMKWDGESGARHGLLLAESGNYYVGRNSRGEILRGHREDQP